LNDCTDRQNQTSNSCLKLTARWLSHIQYIKYTKMYLLYRIYGPHTTKFVVYASIVTALHEIIDLKHRSPWIRLYPLTMKVLLYEIPIASWNPVLESCASRTFKLYKEKFYSSNIKVVTRSLLSFFTLKVLLYEFPIASWNLVFESCVCTAFKPW